MKRFRESMCCYMKM